MNTVARRILFWVVFVVFAVSTCWAGRYHFFGVGYFRPVIVTEQRIIDLGEMLPDAVVEAEISVTNGGWRSLQIAKVRTGCSSCIKILSYPKEPIRRGEAALIRISFDSKSLTGKVRRPVVVMSNDPVRPVYSILVDAVVQYEEEANEHE